MQQHKPEAEPAGQEKEPESGQSDNETTEPGTARYHDFTLDRFQQKAIEAIEAGSSLIVAAPTGAGKTLIAQYAIERALETGSQIVYTAPIKALSNQKFRDFSDDYPEKVGILTGDVSINPDAPILIMTTEIYRNSLLENPEKFAKVSYVIFDEIHFLSDIERGTVWEESILFAPPQSRFLCLSATIPNLNEFADWIREVRDEPLELILETHRPVPLKTYLFLKGKGPVPWGELKRISKRPPKRYRGRRREKQKHQNVLPEVLGHDHLPALYFSFNRMRCEEMAHYFAREYDLLTQEEQREVLGVYDDLCRRFGIEDSPEAGEVRKLVGRGIAYHHAGLLPTIKEVIERCFDTRLIKLLFATETFAMGVNMPASSVVFDSVTKYNGVEIVFLPTRDFHQMAGRAGRRGIDEVGHVYAQIDPRDVDYTQIHRVVHGKIEPIESQFSLSYSSILTLFGRIGEEIFDVAQRSFGAFQARRAGRQEREIVQTIEKELRAKYNVLKQLEYIIEGRVSKKGEFAASIQGHEFITSEFYYRGFFNDLTPGQLAVLVCAIVSEPRREVTYAVPPAGAMKESKWSAIKFVKGLRSLEQLHGVRNPVKEIYFDHAAAMWHWSEGCTFETLGRYTSASSGDLVRTFRQTIQLLRQLRDAIPSGDPLHQALREAVDRVNRGEVDAEKQLRTKI